jgi:peptide/nickel transport system permease protein
VTRYLLRRILQAVPTLLGVVALTFLLFHVVGGSPAAMVLGERVSAQMLEEFDEQRGFNRPLFLGRWTGTRARPDVAAPFGDDIPFDGLPPEAAAHGAVRLAPGTYPLRLRFPLPAAPRYRLDLRVRGEPGTRVTWGDAAEAQAPDARRTRRMSWVWTPDGDTGAPPPLRVEGGAVRITAVELRRGTPHLFDSQFVHYLRALARLDLGVSHVENRRVAAILREGIAPSLVLTIPIFTGGLLAALALSLVCALTRGRRLDRALVVGSVALMSVNYLVWIVLGQYVLAFRLGWFPVWGFESWRHLLLPVGIGIVSGLGADVRFYRTVMLEEMHRDYVRTARAKGAGRARLLVRHVLPNAMIPVLTRVVIALPFLYTGSLLLESFFGIPGLGYLGVNAVNSADVDVLRAVVLIGSVLYMAANVVADAAYAAADPRVRLP